MISLVEKPRPDRQWSVTRCVSIPVCSVSHALVQEKTVGRILSVRAEIGEYMPGWHTYEDYRQMYASRQDLGGGVILSQIHELDYLYWLFGLPRRIFALGGHLSSLEIDVEDTADILMECHAGWSSHCPSACTRITYNVRPAGSVRSFGDAGKILVDLRALTCGCLRWYRAIRLRSSSYEDFQRNQLFLDELKCFLDGLQGKQTPLVSLRDGAQSLRMALAAKESLATGKVVELER